MSVVGERRCNALYGAGWKISVWALDLSAAVIDGLVIVIASAGSAYFFHFFVYSGLAELRPYVGVGCVAAALLVPRKWLNGNYRPIELLNFNRQVRRLLPEWLMALALLMGLAFALKSGDAFSRGTTAAFAVLGLAALIALRAFWCVAITQALASGVISGRRVVLMGAGNQPEDPSAATLRSYGYDIRRYVELPAQGLNTELEWRDFLCRLNNEVCRFDIDEIIINLDLDRARPLIAALGGLRVIPLPVHLVPDLVTMTLLGKRIRRLGDITTVQVQRPPLSVSERLAKRTIDVIFSVCGLFALLPLFAVVALAIKAESSGPVLFRQTRKGFNGRPFTILKFRTMHVMENGDVVAQATRGDPRITRVGAFLRASSIDELPQLINVLMGEMSIVGPRPHAMAHDNYYDKLIANYALRHHVKPGPTGWAQVNGYRGETPTVELMARRVELDLWYVDHWSLWLDLKTIIQTALQLRTSAAY